MYPKTVKASTQEKLFEIMPSQFEIYDGSELVATVVFSDGTYSIQFDEDFTYDPVNFEYMKSLIAQIDNFLSTQTA